MKKNILIFTIIASMLLSVLNVNADSSSLYGDDFNIWNNATYRQSDDKNWFAFNGTPMLYNDGARTIYSTEIYNTSEYTKMKYRLTRTKLAEKSWCLGMSYNSSYDKSANYESSNTNEPYIMLRNPLNTDLTDGQQMVLEAEVWSSGPAATVSVELSYLVNFSTQGSIFKNLVQLDSSGYIYAGSECPGKWQKDTKYKVTAVFRKGTRTADIYINGYLVCAGYSLLTTDRTLDAINKVYLYGNFDSTTSGSVYYDNLKLSNGEYPTVYSFDAINLSDDNNTLIVTPDTTKDAVLNLAKGYTAELSEETLTDNSILTVSNGIFERKYKIAIIDDTLSGGSVFCNSDFEDYDNRYNGMFCTTKDNKFSFNYKSYDDFYLTVSKANTSDCHVDCNIYQTVKNVTMEADIMFPAFGSETDIFRVRDVTSNSAEAGVVTVSKTGVLMANSGYYSKQLTANKWYRVAVSLNVDTKKATLYLDENLSDDIGYTKEAENFRFINADIKTISLVRLWIKSGSSKGTVSVDNYKVYESTAPTELNKLPFKKVLASEADLAEVCERPSASEISGIFNEKNVQHPRIIATQEEFNAVRNDSSKASDVSRMLSSADTIVSGSKALLSYNKPDGIRLLETSREMLRRMEYLGFAYQMTNDTKYVERAWKEIVAVGDFKDWSTSHIIDTGEMLAAVAIGYDWMYSGFNDMQKQYIEEILINKGLRYMREAYYGKLYGGQSTGPSQKFVTWESNFNIVANGGATMAALALADKYPDMCFDILENAIRSSEYTCIEFAPGGAWNEGVMYWNYTMKYFTKFISTLENSLKTNFGFMGFEGIDKTAQWAFTMDSPRGFNNFHDSGNYSVDPYSYSWFGHQTGNQLYYDMRYNAKTMNGKNLDVYDLLWYNGANVKSTPDLKRDFYAPGGIESVSMRESWNDKNGMFFSTHAGYTIWYHSHADCGSFIFDIMNERWALDLGADSYNISGTLYRKETEGHNTISIDGKDQSSDGYAPVTEHCFYDKGGYAIYDMTSEYSGYVSSAKRGFAVDDNRRSLTVRDELNLTSEHDVYWFMHTDAGISINGNQVTLTKNGKTVKMDFAVDADSYSITSMNAASLTSTNPNESSNAGVKKVAVKMHGTGEMTCEVKMYPQDENISQISNTSLADWKNNYNANNYVLSGFTQSGNSYRFNVEKKAASDDGVLLLCEYDTALRLIDAKTVDLSNMQVGSKEITGTSQGTNSVVKCFVFTALREIKPYSNTVSNQ